MTPNFTGLNCGSCRRAEVFLASTYYCCVGDKTSDSLIDGFADLTIPCESTGPEPGLHLWPAAKGKLDLPMMGSLGKGGEKKSSSLWTLTRFQLVQEAETRWQINRRFLREPFSPLPPPSLSLCHKSTSSGLGGDGDDPVNYFWTLERENCLWI